MQKLALPFRKFLINYNGSQFVKSKQKLFREMTTEQSCQNNNILLVHPTVRIFCDECEKNITYLTSIAWQDHDCCIGCFAQLTDIPDSYTVRSRTMYSLVEKDWSAVDELVMLSAFQKWGYGNWEEIKDFMLYNGINFTIQEIQQHYQQFYLAQELWLPKLSDTLYHLTKARSMVEMKPPSQNQAKTEPISSQRSPSQISANKNKLKSNVLGYNPKRGDFQVQYDDKAETLIADLEFNDTDTPEEIEYKYKIIEQYNFRLSQREKRKKFTLDHHILDAQSLVNRQYNENRFMKEARSTFQPFTRFQNYQQHEQTIALYSQANQLKSMIEGIKKCRRKIDSKGRVQETVKFLKNHTGQTKGSNPRKIYHIDKSEASDMEHVIHILEGKIKSEDDNEPTKLACMQIFRE